MSSSLFIESSAPTSGIDNWNNDLVVVYGKNGICLDDKGLENILDEKKMSSICVIRLTSSTPNGEDEKEVEIKTKQLKIENMNRIQESYSSKYYESECFSTKMVSKKNAECRNQHTRGSKIKTDYGRNRSEMPKVLGLSLEKFYSLGEADEIIKKALNLSGQSRAKNNSDNYDFLLYVIKNDHCYTAFKCPTQMHSKVGTVNTKLPEQSSVKKGLVEKPTSALSPKQHFFQNKIAKQFNLDSNTSNISKEKNLETIFREVNAKFGKNEIDVNCNIDYVAKDRDRVVTKEYSNDFGNDRKTDLDYDNNFEGKRRKVRLIKHNSGGNRKSPQKLKQPKCQSALPKQTQNIAVAKSLLDVATRPTFKMSLSLDEINVNSEFDNITSTINSVNTTEKLNENNIKLNVRCTHVTSQANLKNKPRTIVPYTLSPAVQNTILIDKKTISGSLNGGFATIHKLMEQSDTGCNSDEIVKTNMLQQQSRETVTSSFFNLATNESLPLDRENDINTTSAAHNLINPFQKCSELASENGKRLDLINALVHDDLQKPNINKNIPELVRMLESSEKVFEKKITSSNLNKKEDKVCGNVSSAKIDFELSNDLSAENNSYLPDDIFQLVGIAGENTLKVLSTRDKTEDINKIPHPDSLSPIEQQIDNIKTIKDGSMCTVPTSEAYSYPPQLAHKGTACVTSQPTKTAPKVRIDSVKVFRGNGRVITLPPIEAPTTRARKRALTQPIINQSIPNCIETVSQHKSKARSTASRKIPVNKQNLSDESDFMNEDDDDPDKLWCICRQPHNNRFMICCDVCEEWFHGTCVFITKPMGLEMEAKGIDWTCPKCVELEEKGLAKNTKLLPKKNPVDATAHILTSCNEILTGSTSSEQYHQLNTFNVASKETSQKIITSRPLMLQSGNFINFNDFLSSSEKKVKIKTPCTNLPRQGKCLANISTAVVDPMNSFSGIKRTSNCNVQQVHGQKSIEAINTLSQSTQNTYISTSSRIEEKAKNVADPSTMCIVCRITARANSIYCSDDCIRKHAESALETNMKNNLERTTFDNRKNKINNKGLFEDVLSMADLKPRVERVSVIDRKSGRILTGFSCPTVSNLKKWLQENPTFEVIQAGSPRALDAENTQKLKAHTTVNKLIKTNAASSRTLNLVPSKSPAYKDMDISTSKSSQLHNEAKHVINFQKRSSKNLLHNERYLTNSEKSLEYTSNQSVKIHSADKLPKSSKISSDSTFARGKMSYVNRQLNSHCVLDDFSMHEEEPIRQLVRKTLKEQLLLRTRLIDVSSDNISNVPALTLNEVEEYAMTTELEMYNYFNRDTGMKYKAKYRSILFNLKDRKNHNLFAKISSKQIEPGYLVRMTPDEMASQELAQWREQEYKHQLEIIKKSELDLLARTKSYVVKTHKGEELIERKSPEYDNVDLSISLEGATYTNNGKNVLTRPITNWQLSPLEKDKCHKRKHIEIYCKAVDNSKNYSKEKKSIYKDRPFGKKDNSDGSLDSDREHMLQNKECTREKARSRKRSQTRSRTVNSVGGKRHKSCPKLEQNSNVKERTNDRLQSSAQINIIPDQKDFFENTPEPLENNIKMLQKPHSLISYNLIDQILESTKTVEEAANLISDKSIRAKVSKHKICTKSHSNTSLCEKTKDTKYNCNKDSQSPSSLNRKNVGSTNITTFITNSWDSYTRFMLSDNSSTAHNYQKTVWTGEISMIDVTSFNISIKPVFGNCGSLSKLLPKELKVVGRISPETVWDYLSKIRKSQNKEISLLNLIPAKATEHSPYKVLYDYFDNRNRLGVVKSVSPHIRDFYIYPLAAGKKIPAILRPNESAKFDEPPTRPDILIGIIIRVISKQSLISVQDPSIGKKALSRFFVNANEVGLQTAPRSPKLKTYRRSSAAKNFYVDAIIKAPKISKSHKVAKSTLTMMSLAAADEPYTPGGSSDEDIGHVELSYNSRRMKTDEDVLKRKMEEINRQIAVQEMEIAGLLTGEGSL